jgi:hypothetical protein
MINWNDVLNFADKGNLAPDRRVEKTEAEWKSQLTPEQYRITRNKGTAGSCAVVTTRASTVVSVAIPNFLIPP